MSSSSRLRRTAALALVPVCFVQKEQTATEVFLVGKDKGTPGSYRHGFEMPLMPSNSNIFMSRRNGTFCPKVGEMGVGEMGVGEPGITLITPLAGLASI